MQNTAFLDNQDEIMRYDTQNMLDSAEQLYLQIQHAWESTREIIIPLKFEFHHIIVAGMGGSGLGADVIKSLFKAELTVPIEIIHNYTAPNYINEHTLVILSSYSGTTEEILEFALQAKNKQCQIAVITAGGKLAEMAKKEQWPMYLIDPKYNSCNQPRQAIGYSIVGIMGICERAGLLNITQEIFEEAIDKLRQVGAECTRTINTDVNPAKLLAYQMLDKQVVLVASDFLEGAIHVSTNQSNENAKSFTSYHVVPELTHHLLEGLKFPSSLTHSLLIIFFNSNLYHPSNHLRVKLTERIFSEANLETITINLEGSTPIAQVFELIALMSFASIYQAVLQKIDPTPIPVVDAFKESMHESRQN